MIKQKSFEYISMQRFIYYKTTSFLMCKKMGMDTSKLNARPTIYVIDF